MIDDYKTSDDTPAAASRSALARRYGGAAFVIAIAAVAAASWLERQATAAGPALASARSAPDISARLAQLPKPLDAAPRESKSLVWFWRADTTPTASIRTKPQFKNFVTDPSVGMPQ
jgi:hypothetical protein